MRGKKIEAFPKVQQVYCYQGMGSVGKGKGSGVFSNKSSRKPNTCFALHMHVHDAPSQNGETLSQPQVALAAQRLSYLVWNMQYFVRYRGKREGPHAYTHHPHFI